MERTSKTLFAQHSILVFCHVIVLKDITTYLLKAYPGDASKEICWHLRLLNICTSYLSVLNAICDVSRWKGTRHLALQGYFGEPGHFYALSTFNNVLILFEVFSLLHIPSTLHRTHCITWLTTLHTLHLEIKWTI